MEIEIKNQPSPIPPISQLKEIPFPCFTAGPPDARDVYIRHGDIWLNFATYNNNITAHNDYYRVTNPQEVKIKKITIELE